MAELRAPQTDGEVLALPGFDQVPRLVRENRRRIEHAAARVRIAGRPLGDLRQLARREALALANSPDRSDSPDRSAAGLDPDAPLLLSGHQPELSHPGVWVKNFALNALASKLGGVPLFLIADSDTLKSPVLRVPSFDGNEPRSARLQPLAFDAETGEVPYEDRRVIDPERFLSLPARAAELWKNWGYEPLLPRVWPRLAPSGRTLGELFTALRRDRERAWGCLNRELGVSRLSQTESFRRFAAHILSDLSRFRAVYNAAIRSYRRANRVRSRHHPAPELAEGEAPFWVRTASGRRERATGTSDLASLRPRALTLTLFARLVLGDLFIHGIGGGKYDEVTDAICRDYFGIEPPAYLVLSGTLYLPLPVFTATADELNHARRLVRDLHWNPQRHLPQGPDRDAVVCAWVNRKQELVSSEPPKCLHSARRRWYRELRAATERLRSVVAEQLRRAEAEANRLRDEVRANAVLRRRDYAWVLYPEDRLGRFLQRLLRL